MSDDNKEYVMAKKIEINQGDRYGRLTIIREATAHSFPNGRKQRKVLARCECGSEKVFFLNHLRRGHAISCGCYHKEMVTTHGLEVHPLYRRWNGIMDRCYNPSSDAYHNYGGRGIKVCDEWINDAEKFIKWVENESNYYSAISKYGKVEIDRIDNNGNYEPSNCHFVDRSTNNMNQRVRGAIKYRGVSYNKSKGKYEANVTFKRRKKYIGTFLTAIQAAKAYDKYVKDNDLPNKLNFANR